MEWNSYDDEVVLNKGNWHSVIEFCVKNSCYPTVLMFEKSDKLFAEKLSLSQIISLFKKAN